MRRGVVPNPNSEPLVGRGQLTSVWLGGLANPAAVVTSLKHEKAAMVGCRVDEVKLYLFFFFFFFQSDREYHSVKHCYDGSNSRWDSHKKKFYHNHHRNVLRKLYGSVMDESFADVPGLS